MAQIDLGKLKFQWKGLWTTSTAYEVDDVVHYDGSTYVVVTDVPATNTTEPGQSSSFELMARGVNFRGAYDATATYLHLEVVTYQSASWISIASAPFTGQVPQTGSTYWEVLTPAPASAVVTTPGDMVYNNEENVTARLPIGDVGATLIVKEEPNHDIARKITYSVGTATPATAIATDGNDATNVYGTNAANGTLTLSRGRVYEITFPANGLTYSIKDPAASGYSTAGTNGRITAGVTPDFISNGGTLLFSPDSNTPNTVKIRNEASGTDELTVTVVDMARVPTWEGAGLAGDLVDRAYNDYRNTQTGAIKPVEQHQKYGRGVLNGFNGTQGYRKMGAISRGGYSVQWGNHYNNSTQGNGYGSEAVGLNLNTHKPNPLRQVFRLPDFFFEAVAGVASSAQFLTDLNGNSLDYKIASQPKIIQAWMNRQHTYVLTENGMIFHAGYGTQPSEDGAGNSSSSNYALKYYRPHDASSTELTGANRPKFKQFCCSMQQDSGTGGSFYGLDTSGRVYSVGDNGSGQLGHGNTSDNLFFRQISPSAFNNEEVLFIYATNGGAASVYAITETGKLYAWGDNGVGQLGLGNTTNQTSPQEVTAVSGSALFGKKVTHVAANYGGGDAYAHTYILTDEGKVYACGDAESYGIYLGVYRSDQSNVTTPLELTNASTTYNSDNQKVVSMWCSGQRYNTLFLITNGGDSNNIRMYAYGNNVGKQQGANVSTSSGASASAQGNWFGNECQFMTDSGATSAIRSSVTNRKIGDPVMVAFGGDRNTNSQGFNVLLDEHGTAFISGTWAIYNPVVYFERDSTNDFNGTSAAPNAWTQLTNQPEPFVSVGFGSDTSAEETWTFVGESGLMYVGGYSGYSAALNSSTQATMTPYRALGH